MTEERVRSLSRMFIEAANAIREAEWRPCADVYATDNGWVVKFDLAGVRAEDVHLGVRDNRLFVEGARRDWFAGQQAVCHSMEIAYCRFRREVELPCSLDGAEIAWEFREGMLLVKLSLPEGDR